MTCIVTGMIASYPVGGVLWDTFGFQYVFLFGVFIAIINFFTALQARTPKQVI